MKKILVLSLFICLLLTGCNLSNSALVNNNSDLQSIEINVVDTPVIGINNVILGQQPDKSMLKESILNYDYSYEYNHILFNLDETNCISELCLTTTYLDNYVINIQGKSLVGLAQIEQELGSFKDNTLEYICDDVVINIEQNKESVKINIIRKK